MVWRIVARPGYSGKKKYERHANWDKKYGKDNWRTVWKWNGAIITRESAYQLYEDGYYHDSFNHEKTWQELLNVARDVYDLESKDTESGLDYLIQNGIATHLQDISIRRVLLRRGWNFHGEELVKIRGHEEYWGNLFSPGKIPFHLPDLIESAHIEGWWDYNSIEDFYQSNKVLQVKE